MSAGPEGGTADRAGDRSGLDSGLWQFVRAERRRFGLALLLLALSFGFELLGPYLVERAVDGPLRRSGDPSSRAELRDFALGLFGCAVAGAALGLGFARSTARAGQNVVLALRRALARAFERSELSWIEDRALGRSLTNLTTDVENLDQAVTSGAVQALFDLLRVAGFLIAIAISAPSLGLYLAVLLPLVALLSLRFRKRARQRYGAVRSRVSRQNGLILESLRGAETLRALRAGPRFRGRIEDANHETRSAWLATVQAYSAFFAATDIALRLTQAGLLLVGGLQVVDGGQRAGELLRTWLYLQLLSRPLRELGERFHTLQAARSSLVRLLEVLRAPRAPQGPGSAGASLPGGALTLEVRGLCFAYAGGEPVLTDLEFRLDRGETVALVGATGAGKSTLFRLIARLHEPGSGSISVGDTPLPIVDEVSLRDRLGLATQGSPLVGSTIREVLVADRPGLSDRDVVDALDIADPLGRVGRDLDRVVLDGTGRTRASAGEARVLALARSLAPKPGLLLLDEPSAALDPQTEASFRSALEHGRADRTTLVIAHRLETVFSCDRVLVLDGGRLVESGSPRELRRRGGPFARMLVGSTTQDSLDGLSPETDRP